MVSPVITLTIVIRNCPIRLPKYTPPIQITNQPKKCPIPIGQVHVCLAFGTVCKISQYRKNASGYMKIMQSTIQASCPIHGTSQLVIMAVPVWLNAETTRYAT